MNEIGMSETQYIVSAEMQQMNFDNIIVVRDGELGYLGAITGGTINGEPISFLPQWTKSKDGAWKFETVNDALEALGNSSGKPWMYVPKMDTAKVMQVTKITIEREINLNDG